MHLKRLTRKEAPFIYPGKCEEFFEKIKALLLITFTLSLLVKGKDFTVIFGTSVFSLGDVLIKDKNMIAYASIKFKPYDKNFPIHDFKLVAWIVILMI